MTTPRRHARKIEVYFSAMLFLLLSMKVAAQPITWYEVGRVQCGQVTALTHDRTGFTYASTERTFFRSNNGGRSWEIMESFRDTIAGLICLDNRILMWNNAGGLIRSTNLGKDWIPVSTEHKFFDPIVVDSAGRFFGADKGAIIGSANGYDWETVRASDGAERVVMAVAGNGTMYALLYSRSVEFADRLLRSVDSGASWSEIDSPGLPDGIHRLAAAPNGDLYVGTSGNGAFRSTDGGVTWNDLPIASLPDTIINDIAITGDGSVLIVVDGGFMVSHDEGKSWSEHAYGAAHLPFTCASVGTGTFLIGARGGVLREAADRTWTWSNTGLNERPAAVLTATRDGRLYTFDGAQWYRSDDGGVSWINLRKVGWGVENGLIELPSGSLLVITRDTVDNVPSMSIDRSTSHGDQWDRRVSGHGQIYTMALDPEGRAYASTDLGVYRSSDDGMTWEEFGNFRNALVPMLISFEGDHLLAVCQGGDVITAPRSDGVVHWQTSLEFGSMFSPVVLQQLPSGTWLLVAWESSVFKSTDGGATWRIVLTYPEAQSFSDLVVDSLGRAHLVAWQSGTFISIDDGETWQREQEGLPDGNFSSLAVASDGRVYLGGVAGVFASTPPPPAAVPAAPAHATAPRSGMAIELRPSPASRATTLHVRLERSCSLTLRLYDTFGREVLPPRPLHLERGEHDLPLDISALAPGAYLCVVDGDAGPVATRLVVAR